MWQNNLMKNLIFLTIALLIISPVTQANDNDGHVLSCSDPIPKIRWPELCKEGYNLNFLVDYFQGKYNDASYDQYRKCSYIAARARLPKFENSGKSKEEFYEGIDEKNYLIHQNFNTGIRFYYHFSLLAPFKLFNPSVSVEDYAEFIKRDNKRIGNSFYDENFTYGSLNYNQILNIYQKECVLPPTIRLSYAVFLSENLKKPFEEQVWVEEISSNFMSAFTKMDNSGKVEGLEFSEWLIKNESEKAIRDSIVVWNELHEIYLGLWVAAGGSDSVTMDDLISDYCIKIHNSPICPYIDSNQNEFDKPLWDNINKAMIAATAIGDGKIMDLPRIEWVKHSYCVQKYGTTRCFEGQ
tara:strand:- start:78 stop:1136 length:1059 start_codon:yes stop_codon:yes gene_type:complete